MTYIYTDIFSSALAEAQINLDPYEFIDEDEPVVASTVNTPTSWTTDSVPIWSSSGDNSTFHVSQGMRDCMSCIYSNITTEWSTHRY